MTYEGSRFVVNDLKLLMDTFHRDEFTGTWRRLFSRVKKHIIWGVLKSVTGMQVRNSPFMNPLLDYEHKISLTYRNFSGEEIQRQISEQP